MIATKPLTFMWHELMTTDLPAALEFYRKVIGWETRDSGAPGPSYTLLHAGPAAIGGAMQLTPEMCSQGAKPGWLGYIGVEDVDAHVGHVKAAGGSLLKDPVTIPNMIRFAVVADPYGAPFVIFRGLIDQDMPKLAPGTAGTIGWNELHAGDLDGAWAFYSSLFGWTRDMAVDMGKQGIYQTFGGGGVPFGGMMKRTPETPASFWLYYVNVDGIDAAIARLLAAGGQVAMGPHPVPGGSWIVAATDPQGGMFAMTSLKR